MHIFAPVYENKQFSLRSPGRKVKIKLKVQIIIKVCKEVIHTQDNYFNALLYLRSEITCYGKNYLINHDLEFHKIWYSKQENNHIMVYK